MTGYTAPVPRELLERGCAALRLPLTATLTQKLLRHLELLARWNRRFNLTAIQNPQRMVTHHLLDSLAVLPYAPAGRLLDLGTGAGFPGIPLALARPADHYTLVDSSLKRIRFVRHLVAQLKISNVLALHRRAQQMPADCGFDGVLARAVAAPDEVLSLAAPLLAPGGICLVMCGRPPAVPDPAARGYDKLRCLPLKVPFLPAARHLLVGEKG